MIFQNALLAAMKANADRTAIEYEGRHISYSLLNSRAESVMSWLLSKGISDQAYVGVCLGNRVHQITAVIGIAYARDVFVLLDSSIPQPRMSAMLKDLGLKCIITSKEERDDLGRLYPGIELYDIEEIVANSSPCRYEQPAYSNTDSIYIYFTSGSTGNPKGVIGKNESLLQFIRWEIGAFGIDQSCRCSQLISPYFDAFLRDIFVPLLAGGTVCVPPATEGFMTSEHLTGWLEKEAVSLVHCVPSVFQLINNDLITSGSLPRLANVLLSGERIVPSTLSNWYALFGDRIQLVNLYGATESTMIRACYRIKPADAASARIPIGLPIADTDLVILDRDGKPCNLLVPGELYIASPYITKGYLNNPALNDSRFIRLHIEGKGEVPAFRTGDKARRLANGMVDLIGREDRQVKLRGIRIELDEIEYMLMQWGGLASAVVTKEGLPNQEGFLAAYVVPANAAEDATGMEVILQQHLATYLPDYMYPSRILVLKELPLLSNGKTDYGKLTGMLQQKEIIAPTDETEEKLLQLWKEILGTKTISTADTFQQAGGNSLSMMRLIGRISKVFGVHIALSDLFTHLTILKQAVLIRNSVKNDAFSISKAVPMRAYHLSAAQERIYYNFEVNRKRTSYNMPLAWEINGVPDVHRITQTFRLLIKRHETLRTAFAIEHGHVVQIPEEDIDFSPEIIDAGFMHDGDWSVQEAIHAFIRPFDLAKPPLFRCGIIQAPGRKSVLVLDIHHIICDGFSQQILLADFIKLYRGDELPPLAVQYKDYAEWEHAFKTKEAYITLREFWLRNFDGDIPVLQFPTLSTNTNDVSDKGGNYIFEIDKAEWHAMLNRVKDASMTVFPSLYSLYFIFLCHLSGQEDIICGVTTSGRMQEEVQGIIGMFVKTLPVRYRLDASMTFSELLLALNDILIQANSKQAYDLSDIISELNNRRPRPIKELFNVAFVFQNFEQQRILKEEKMFTAFEFENPNSKYPLTLYVAEHENTFVCRLEYAYAYFSPTDMQILAADLQSIAARIIADPYARVGEIIRGGICEARVVADDFTFNFKRN